VNPRALLSTLPGLALVVALALLARYAHGKLPPRSSALAGEPIVALLVGFVAGNVLRIPKFAQPGIRFAMQTLLRGAIVLLGATLSFAAVAAIGRLWLLLLVALTVLALIVALAFARFLGVPGKLGALIGIGTAVCGHTAILAVAPAIGAKDEETSSAIAANTLCGVLAVLAYPAVARALGMTDPAYGTWAGTAMSETSHPVAIAFACSQASGKIATAIDVARIVLMGGVIVVMGLFYAGGGPVTARSVWERLKHSVPAFVLGFLAMALLHTLGAVTWASHHLGRDLVLVARNGSKFLILSTLAGVGLGTRFDAIRGLGLRAFWVGLATALAASGAGYAMIRLFGPAGGL
jgi:uncharacterized integral membrane protein (TIGR00698 family)